MRVGSPGPLRHQTPLHGDGAPPHPSLVWSSWAAPRRSLWRRPLAWYVSPPLCREQPALLGPAAKSRLDVKRGVLGGARILGVCTRRATPRGGMQMRSSVIGASATRPLGPPRRSAAWTRGCAGILSAVFPRLGGWCQTASPPEKQTTDSEKLQVRGLRISHFPYDSAKNTSLLVTVLFRRLGLITYPIPP